MIGLPTETNEDLDGIVDIVKRMQEACQQIRRDKSLSIKGNMDVNVTISNFVPKPHTPFQWHPQDSMAMMREKNAYLRNQFYGMKGVKVNYTDAEISKLEAVISKGGPELADVLEKAYNDGAYLDAWDDISNFQVWFKALHALGFDEEQYTRERLIGLDDELPWDNIHMGLDKEWLKEEFTRSVIAKSTTPCFETCSTCGVCATYSTWPSFIDTPEKPKTLKIVRETRAEHLMVPAVGKVRLQIEKMGDMRFISHLDWLRLVHRALKRAKVPVAYSQGFSPKPKTTFTSALPLFMESRGEYLDVDVIAPCENVAEAMNPFLPKGSKIISEEHLSTQSPRINRLIERATYTAKRTCKNPENAVKMKEAISSLLSTPTWVIEAETKSNTQTLDIKPYLYDVSSSNNNTVSMVFTTKPTTADAPQRDLGSLKPEWVLSCIDNSADWRVERTLIELRTV
jgi:radical SAM-linked protein